MTRPAPPAGAEKQTAETSIAARQSSSCWLTNLLLPPQAVHRLSSPSSAFYCLPLPFIAFAFPFCIFHFSLVIFHCLTPSSPASSPTPNPNPPSAPSLSSPTQSPAGTSRTSHTPPRQAPS